VNFQAFTLASPAGKFREIISQADIQQARRFCAIFDFPLENVTVNALWDTGASNTVISQRIAKSLKLVAVDAVPVIGVSGIMRSNIYRIDVRLPCGLTIEDVHASEFIESDQFDILIGMDIITLGDFAITNHNNKTVVSFRTPPDVYHIDFMKK
jgi:hypothetical protein